MLFVVAGHPERIPHAWTTEVVVFSWIVYDSREHRDTVNAKVMEDPRMKGMMDPKNMPFDGMRMFWGGFKSFLELSSTRVAGR